MTEETGAEIDSKAEVREICFPLQKLQWNIFHLVLIRASSQIDLNPLIYAQVH